MTGRTSYEGIVDEILLYEAPLKPVPIIQNKHTYPIAKPK